MACWEADGAEAIKGCTTAIPRGAESWTERTVFRELLGGGLPVAHHRD